MPARLERRLILWAYVRNQPSLPSWISTLLALRVSANWEKIEAELEREAEHMEMPRTQLETLALEKYGFDFDREIAELEGDE